MRRKAPELAPPGSLFATETPAPAPVASRPAVDEPPYATRRQATRWQTQDEAYSAKSDTTRAEIIRSLQADGPATCDEMELRLGLTHQTCSARINDLFRAGTIVADGSRPTRSGRRARVWRLAAT
jgi:hypothetical protein